MGAITWTFCYLPIYTVLEQELICFSVKGQIVNVLGFMGHIRFALQHHLYFFVVLLSLWAGFNLQDAVTNLSSLISKLSTESSSHFRAQFE